MLKGKKGFTLIELMIVVAIIGILAAIAIPNFLKFQAKSKQSEAKTNLKGIYTAETGYFGEQNTYNSFDSVNWAPVGKAKYRYEIGADGGVPVPPAGPGAGSVFVLGNTDETGAIVSPLGFGQNFFSSAAVGNVDNDTGLDEWRINSGNVLENPVNDVL